MEKNTQKIALLIDADNVSHKYIKSIIDELSNYGVITHRRAYADWTSDTKKKTWKSVVLENSLSPIQQFAYTSGKNSSDSALIIDAMDILYADNVDAFCIISSDSDFIRLAQRLREACKTVYGMGEKKTSEHFVKSCDRFIYLESLNDQEKVSETEGVGRLDGKNLGELEKVIAKCIRDNADEEGLVILADVGNYIYKRYPEFDPRNYGATKLVTLVKKLKHIDVIETPSLDNPHNKVVYIKLKPKTASRKTEIKSILASSE